MITEEEFYNGKCKPVRVMVENFTNLGVPIPKGHPIWPPTIGSYEMYVQLLTSGMIEVIEDGTTALTVVDLVTAMDKFGTSLERLVTQVHNLQEAAADAVRSSALVTQQLKDWITENPEAVQRMTTKQADQEGGG